MAIISTPKNSYASDGLISYASNFQANSSSCLDHCGHGRYLCPFGYAGGRVGCGEQFLCPSDREDQRVGSAAAQFACPEIRAFSGICRARRLPVRKCRRPGAFEGKGGPDKAALPDCLADCGAVCGNG